MADQRTETGRTQRIETGWINIMIKIIIIYSREHQAYEGLGDLRDVGSVESVPGMTAGLRAIPPENASL